MISATSRSSRVSLAVVALLIVGACNSSDDSAEAPPEGSSTIAPAPSASSSAAITSAADPAEQGDIAAVMESAMTEYDLRALIVRVTRDGQEVYTGALGESMNGVAATTDMHVRNGAVAYTYLGQVLVMLADEGIVSLDDTVSEYLPDLPSADEVTLRMLANCTSGYADYVYTPELLSSTDLTPYREFATDELIEIGTAAPMLFEPGTNWGYSHTNFSILGKVMETATGRPLAELMNQYIVDAMGLISTASTLTPYVPEPVLHTWSSERRAGLKIPADLPFYEDSTYWDSSWTTPTGAVMTTNIFDLARSAEVVGSGELVSPEGYEEQTSYALAGLGETTEQCPVCFPLTEQRSYGLGVVLLNGWITQTKLFAGSGASIGYLPSERLAIAVITTLTPDAFDEDGAGNASSDLVMTDLAAALTDTLPAVGS